MEVLLCAPMIHVFGVDIGYDGDCRRESVERAVAFIRLDHHPFAAPDSRI